MGMALESALRMLQTDQLAAAESACRSVKSTFFRAPRHEPSRRVQHAPRHEWHGSALYGHDVPLSRGVLPRGASRLRRDAGLRVRGARMPFCGGRRLSSKCSPP